MIFPSLSRRVFVRTNKILARHCLARRFWLTLSLHCQKKVIAAFTFDGEIRKIMPDYRKLNLGQENYVNIGVTAIAGFIGIHGFKKRTKDIPIESFTNIREAVGTFFITLAICPI